MKKLSKEDILQAILYCKKNGIPENRKSRLYELQYQGENFPPKYIYTIAHKLKFGVELKPDNLDGGIKLNEQIEKLGFKIVSVYSIEDKTIFEPVQNKKFVMDVISFVIEGHPRDFGLPANRDELFIQIINESTADLIVFPGWTLKSKETPKLLAKITNNKSIVFFENYIPSAHFSTYQTLCLFDGKIFDMESRQVFTEAKEVDNNHQLVKDYLQILREKRLITFGDKNFLLITCGENNILKNKQSEHNKVEFRVDDVTLENEFATILNSANFIINPIHTPMGNQGKISKRREYFSANNKIYISTNNIEVELGKSVEKLLQRKLQYVLKNSVSIEPFSTKIDVDNCFISNQYLLDE